MLASMTIPTTCNFIAARAAAARKDWTFPAPNAGAAVDGGLVLTGSVLQFAKDSTIYAEGEPTRAFYKVMHGVVRTCRYLKDGHRQIDAFYLPGNVFGLEIGPERRLAAEAASDCVLISCGRCKSERFGQADEFFARQLFSYAMRCLQRAQQHAQLLCHKSAVWKIAGFLLDMAERTPSREGIDLPMARQDIADYLGMTIETVSRTLSQLERETVITIPTARRIVMIDRAKLRRLGS